VIYRPAHSTCTGKTGVSGTAQLWRDRRCDLMKSKITYLTNDAVVQLGLSVLFSHVAHTSLNAGFSGPTDQHPPISSALCPSGPIIRLCYRIVIHPRASDPFFPFPHKIY